MSGSTWADCPFPLISTPACNIGYTDQSIRSASRMALAHNVIIRGLNSIYLQCPDVAPARAAAFITYCQCWSEFIHTHHECEGAAYFSLIEEVVGSAGTADENVNQHEAFMSGLHEFDRYLLSVSPSPSTFSGTSMLQILDSFAAKLQMHLRDEIVWIQSLAQSYPDLDLAPIDARHETYLKQRSTKTRILPFLLTNHDRTYENGIHDWWPTGNTVGGWFLRYICTLVHSGAWRYSSCSKSGEPKCLGGVKKEVIKKGANGDSERGDVIEMTPRRPKFGTWIQSRADSQW